MFERLGQFSELVRNAGKIRETLEAKAREARDLRAEGTAGGGSVVAVASGDQRLISVRIDPALVAEGDVELIEELATEAVNQAFVKAREAWARRFNPRREGFRSRISQTCSAAAAATRSGRPDGRQRSGRRH